MYNFLTDEQINYLILVCKGVSIEKCAINDTHWYKNKNEEINKKVDSLVAQLLIVTENNEDDNNVFFNQLNDDLDQELKKRLRKRKLEKLKTISV